MRRKVYYSDHQIVTAIQTGSRSEANKVMQYLYKTHYPLIKKFVVKNRGTEEHAADVFQDAMVVFHKQVKEGKFQSKSTIKTYLYSIVRNIWLKQIKANSNELIAVVDMLDDLADVDNNDSVFDISKSAKVFKELMAELKGNCEQVLIDYYYNEFSMKMIMEKYGLQSLATAKNKKYRCLQFLIKIIREKNIKIKYFID
ncbi:MAG: sigma-70 family RNA polymerase sigma factor [Bacteroidota bacterium]